MPFYRRTEAEYLREKAAQFRRLAQEYVTPISAQLIEIAVRLDQRAEELEKAPPSRPRG